MPRTPFLRRLAAAFGAHPPLESTPSPASAPQPLPPAVDGPIGPATGWEPIAEWFGNSGAESVPARARRIAAEVAPEPSDSAPAHPLEDYWGPVVRAWFAGDDPRPTGWEAASRWFRPAVAGGEAPARPDASPPTGWEALEDWIGASGERARPASARLLTGDQESGTREAPAAGTDPWAAAMSRHVASRPTGWEALEGWISDGSGAGRRSPARGASPLRRVPDAWSVLSAWVGPADQDPAEDPWKALDRWVRPAPASPVGELPETPGSSLVVHAGAPLPPARVAGADDDAPSGRDDHEEPRAIGAGRAAAVESGPEATQAAAKALAVAPAPSTEAEVDRGEAERERQRAEGERDQAEDARVEAEDERRQAETSRMGAEDERRQAETSRMGAEDERRQAETARADAEGRRQFAELGRRVVSEEAQEAARRCDAARDLLEQARAHAVESVSAELTLLAQLRAGIAEGAEAARQFADERGQALERELIGRVESSLAGLGALRESVAAEVASHQDEAQQWHGRISEAIAQASEACGAAREALQESRDASAQSMVLAADLRAQSALVATEHTRAEGERRAAHEDRRQQARALRRAQQGLEEATRSHQVAREEAERVSTTARELTSRLGALDDLLARIVTARASVEADGSAAHRAREAASEAAAESSRLAADAAIRVESLAAVAERVGVISAETELRGTRAAELLGSIEQASEHATQLIARTAALADQMAVRGGAMAAQSEMAGEATDQARTAAVESGRSALAASEALSAARRSAELCDQELEQLRARALAQESHDQQTRASEVVPFRQEIRQALGEIDARVEVARTVIAEAVPLCERAEHAASRAEEAAESLVLARLEDARRWSRIEERVGDLEDGREDPPGDSSLADVRALEERVGDLEEAGRDGAPVDPSLADALAQIHAIRADLDAEREQIGREWALLGREQGEIATQSAQLRALLETARAALAELVDRPRDASAPGDAPADEVEPAVAGSEPEIEFEGGAEQVSEGPDEADPLERAREMVRSLRPRVDAALRTPVTDTNALTELRVTLRDMIGCADHELLDAHHARAEELLQRIAA